MNMNIKQQLDMQARYTAQAMGVTAPTEPEAFTPETIDAMSKGDLRDMAEAHGVEIPKGTNIQDMRGMVKAAIFTGL